jgi:hypothetical protein
MKWGYLSSFKKEETFHLKQLGQSCRVLLENLNLLVLHLCRNKVFRHLQVNGSHYGSLRREKRDSGSTLSMVSIYTELHMWNSNRALLICVTSGSCLFDTAVCIVYENMIFKKHITHVLETWCSVDRASQYISVVKPTRCTFCIQFITN